MVAAAAGYLAVASASFVVGAAFVEGANHAPSGSFGIVSFGGGDYAYNWDFENSGGSVSTNVDWPMRFMFIDDAEVE